MCVYIYEENLLSSIALTSMTRLVIIAGKQNCFFSLPILTSLKLQ